MWGTFCRKNKDLMAVVEYEDGAGGAGGAYRERERERREMTSLMRVGGGGHAS